MDDTQPFSFEDAQRFLTALDPQATAFTFQTFGEQEKLPELARVFNGTFDSLAKQLFDLNTRGAGVYVTVSLTDLHGRKRDNIIEPRAVFCDFDGVEPPRGSGALPVSMRVQSRNGKHLYWFLQPGESLDKWGLVQEALARKLGADLACKDPPRVMRLAGTQHRKAEPFPVKLIDCQPDRRYTLDQVIHAYALDLTPPAAPEPRPTRIWPSSGGTGPADDFNARGDWSMLERHGWLLLQTYGEEQRWSRPGRDPPSVSATTDHDGHTGIFYCFSSNAAPFFDANQGYSRFQVFSILEHGGDYKAAARELVAKGFGDDDREKWLAERVREREAREEEAWERTLASPPPQPRRRRAEPPRASEPPPWLDVPFEPRDEDAPPGTEQQHQDPGKRDKGKGGKGGKGKGAKGKGGKGGKGKGGKKGGRRSSIKDPQDGLVDFRISSVKILDSDPPVYYFEIEGARMLELEPKHLDSPRMFRRRFMERLHRRPSVPTDEDDWNDLVNYWLGLATIVDQPEETSEMGRLRSELRDMLRGLGIGDDPSDLDRGRVLAHPKQKKTFLVKVNSLHQLLKDRIGQPVPPNALGAQLRALNCDDIRIRLGGVQLRVWSFKRTLDDPEGWADPDAPGEDEGGQGSLPTVH